MAPAQSALHGPRCKSNSSCLHAAGLQLTSLTLGPACVYRRWRRLVPSEPRFFGWPYQGPHREHRSLLTRLSRRVPRGAPSNQCPAPPSSGQRLGRLELSFPGHTLQSSLPLTILPNSSNSDNEFSLFYKVETEVEEKYSHGFRSHRCHKYSMQGWFMFFDFLAETGCVEWCGSQYEFCVSSILS